MSLLEVREVSHAYGHHHVLRGVSFTLEAGTVACLLGPNGAGKTTLLSCVLGLSPSMCSHVWLDGHALSAMRDAERAQCMAYVPQAQPPVFGYTVLEMVMMGASAGRGMRVPGNAEKKLAQTMLESVGLAHLADRLFMRVSGGERQLTLIARALAQQPKLLVMDEPTANLDFGNQHRILQCVRTLAEKGLGVLLSTHHPDHALRYADQALCLLEGRMISTGTPRVVLDPDMLRRLYQIEATVETIHPGRSICLPTDASNSP
ncbi:MAG: ABC transporter ATP-binding protein [Clostridia bacterium]